MSFRMSNEGIFIPLFSLFLAQFQKLHLFVSVAECGTFALWLAAV